MRRTTAAAATVLAAGILVGGGVGVASAFDHPAQPGNGHAVTVQYQEQHRDRVGGAPTVPSSTVQTATPDAVTGVPGDGICDGTCDGTPDRLRDQIRDQARDGTCDGTGVQQQAHHMESGPHH